MGIKGITQGEKKESNPSKNTMVILKLLFTKKLSSVYHLPIFFFSNYNHVTLKSQVAL